MPIRLKLFFLFATALLSPQLSSQTTSNAEAFRLEGAYSIQAKSIENDNERYLKILDRLVIYTSPEKGFYTIALSTSKLDVPLEVFHQAKATFQGETIVLHAEGEMNQGAFGEVQLTLDAQTLSLRGIMISSKSSGYIHIEGTPIYSLSDCLYTISSEASFPSIEELEAEYIDANGVVMILRRFSSGAISLVLEIPLKHSEPEIIVHKKGSYLRDLGLISFHYFVEHTTQGKANITYRLDENGRPYLKLFSLSANGRQKVRKFYFHRKIINASL